MKRISTALSIIIAGFLSNNTFSAPTFMSPNWMDQPVKDLPIAVSIITAKQIEQRGYQTIIEALQDVPGMKVIYASHNEPHIAYQSGIANNSENIAIAIDDTIIQNNQMRRTVLSRLPISIHEVKRIVIWRGAGVSSYGYSSASVTINIERKKADDPESSQVWVGAGDIETRTAGFSYAWRDDKTRFYLSGSQDQNEGSDGYETDIIDTYRMENKVQRINTSIKHQFGIHSVLFEFTKTDAYQTVPFYFIDTPNDDRFSETMSYTFNYKVTPTNSSSFDLIYNYNKDDQNSIYKISAPTSTLLLQSLNDLADINIELADNLIAGIPPSSMTPEESALVQQFNDDMQLLGANAAKDILFTTDLSTLSKGEMLKGVYTNVFESGVTLSAEASYYEKSDKDLSFYGNLPKPVVDMSSKRLTISTNYIEPTSNSYTINLLVGLEDNSIVSDIANSFKISYAKHFDKLSLITSYGDVYRMPSLAEQLINYKSSPTILSPLPPGPAYSASSYFRKESPGNFDPQRHIERDLNIIIGTRNYYYGFKIFYNTVKNPIIDPHLVYAPAPFIGEDYDLWGLEAEFNVDGSFDMNYWGSYSYTNNSSERFSYTNTMQLQHTIALGLDWEASRYIQTSLSYHANSDTNYDYGYSRLDAVVNYMPVSSLTLQTLIRYNIESISATPSRYNFNIDPYSYGLGYKNDISLFVTLKYSY